MSLERDIMRKEGLLYLVNMLNQKGFKVYATQGSILHYGKNAPAREGYTTVYPKNNYSKMETK